MGAAAQRVVAVAPDQRLGLGLACCRGQVLLHFFGELPECIVGKAYTGRAIGGQCHAAQAVVLVVAGRLGVGEGFGLICTMAGRGQHMALGGQAPERIAGKQGAFGQRVAGVRAVGGVLTRSFLLALVQLGELAGGVVAVALDAAIKADFLREVVCGVVGKLVMGAVLVLQHDEARGHIVGVAQAVAQCVDAGHGLIQPVVLVARGRTQRVGVVRQVAGGVVAIAVLGPIGLGELAQLAQRVYRISGHIFLDDGLVTRNYRLCFFNIECGQ